MALAGKYAVFGKKRGTKTAYVFLFDTKGDMEHYYASIRAFGMEGVNRIGKTNRPLPRETDTELRKRLRTDTRATRLVIKRKGRGHSWVPYRS